MKHITILISVIILYSESIAAGIENHKNQIPSDTVAFVPEQKLPEVIVTASESSKATSSSKIDLPAMQHLQPSSFSDLLELLPGGKAQVPDMNSANLIRLREAGSSSEVMSSLGVAFVVDGVAIDNDANLQYVPDISSDRTYVSQGVDMRTLSTDDIESVEVIRGIPSVEYGNLTNGLVNVARRNRKTPLTVRIKVDEYGKNYAIGKGFELSQALLLNTDLSYVDSKDDPRNIMENYKRLSFSSRLDGRLQNQFMNHRWNVSVDYTGSFDNEKTDPEVTSNKEDNYTSSYNNVTVAANSKLYFYEAGIYSGLELSGSLRQSFDRISQRKYVSLSRPMPVPSSLVSGESDGEYLPYQYIATMKVDGKPLVGNLKAVNSLQFPIAKMDSKILIGGEWSVKKNWGEGRVYDILRPISSAASTRPRSYKEIPTSSTLSFFIEENAKLDMAGHKLDFTLGVRSLSLQNLSDKYAMKGRLYFEPRANISWHLPFIMIAQKPLKIDFNAGIGVHRKAPTLAMLYPDALYEDIVQLNYYHNNADYRRLNIRTYTWDNTNYDLVPALNFKWEARLGASYDGYNFSVTYFRENMKNGFRQVSNWHTFEYKTYDYSSIDGNSITSAPSPDEMTYSQDTIISLYSWWDNQNRTEKEGVEFSFSTKRYKSIRTRFSVNGAWFKTTLSNAGLQYKRPTNAVINGKTLGYIGVYDWEDGALKQSFNTNFMFDTYIKELGLIFSTSFQCSWFTSSQNLWNNGTPIAYVNLKGETLPYTESDKTDAVRKLLIQSYSNSYFNENRVPFAGDLNLKATKEIGKSLKIALFVNRLLHFYPDYYVGTTLVRRDSSPYFGMELRMNLK